MDAKLKTGWKAVASLLNDSNSQFSAELLKFDHFPYRNNAGIYSCYCHSLLYLFMHTDSIRVNV